MHAIFKRSCALYRSTARGLESLTPLSLLLFRLWVAVEDRKSTRLNSSHH